MIKSLLKLSAYSLLFFLLNCSTFLLSDKPKKENTFTNLEISVSYELVGWKGKENKIKATEILKAINRSNQFKNVSHFVKSSLEWKIQIILDESPQLTILLGEPVQPVSWVAEKYPFRYLLYIVNRLLSFATRLTLPILQVSQEILTFRVWKGNQKVAEYSYPINSIRAIGWVSILLSPFDDKKHMRQIYSDYALKFLKDSEKIYE